MSYTVRSSNDPIVKAKENMNSEREDFNDLIPSSFTAPIAAKILRTTPESLASLTRTGAIIALPGESWTRYSREELERILGRQLTVPEWLEADRDHDRRREANRRYNRTRRPGVPSAPMLDLVPTKGTA